VADLVLAPEIGMAAEERARAGVLARLRLGDAAFRLLTRAAAMAVLAILGGVIVSLLIGALPALQAFGLDFLIEQRWNPVTEKFGAVAPVYGTLVTSFIAMLTIKCARSSLASPAGRM